MPGIKKQNSARAIVIGVSAYDDMDNVTPLEGCVRDAIAYANWLLTIGVNPKNMVLHVSPDPNVTYDYPVGVHREAATREKIWDSFANLMDIEGGDRLYICASGHGVQTKEGTCFLTQDFKLKKFSSQNLCIDLYIDQFLRGLDFREQYLFVDCCSNYLQVQTMVQKVTSGGPGHQIHEKTKTQIHAFFACQEEERAQQSADGRGIFSSTILDAISADAVTKLWNDYEGKRYFSYDFDHGIWRLELSSLFTEKIATDVEFESEEIDRKFSPRYVPTPNYKNDVYLYELDGEPSTTLTITATPESDLIRLKRITATLSAVKPELNKKQPNRPFTINVPLGRTVKIFGEPVDRADSLKKRPVIVEVKAPKGETARLEFTPPPPPPPRLSKKVIVDAYSTRRTSAPTSDGFGPGPDVGRFSNRGSNEAFSGSFEPPPVGRVGPIITSRQKSPPKNLRIKRAEPVADRIEEGLSDWATLKISRMSDNYVKTIRLADLKSHKSDRLTPGRYLAEIILPWGNWRQLVVLNTGDEAVIEIPNRVGNPPLRFEPSDREHQSWVWHVDTNERLVGGHPRISCYAAIPIRRTAGEGGTIRYEPYSETSSSVWDILITNKRPRLASKEMLVALVSSPPNKITDPCLDVLRLAGAYACLLDHNLELAKSIFEILPRDLISSLDGNLIAYGLHDNECRKTKKVIINRLNNGEIPLLTYGYDLAARWMDLEQSAIFIPLDDDLGTGAWTARYQRRQEAGTVDVTALDELPMVAENKPKRHLDPGEQDLA